MKVAIERERVIAVACVVATLTLAIMTTRAVLERTHGPAVPLDDAYIHFQYARALASGHPFQYTAGATPTPGATSLLWPMILAPFYALGFRGDRLIWAAWGLGWISLGLLAWETRRLAMGLVRPSVAMVALAMVFAFGGFTWFAASGMEVVPLAFLLTRTARRAAEWIEVRRGASSAGQPQRGPSYRELLVLSALCPLMRPEGVLGSALVATALVVRSDGHRARAVPAFLSPLIPPLVCWLFTGQALTSTALAKWLPLNPYFRDGRLLPAIVANVQILFGILLDGELWTSVFLPSGGRVIAWIALLAPAAAGMLRGYAWRGAAVVVFASGMLIPTTYETFLVNRVRYIWPFAPAWIVGLACLAELVGGGVERAAARLGRFASVAPPLIAGVVVVLFLSHLSPSMEDLATSSEAVTLQQVSLGKWAAKLPETARLGVNDTGAIAYFSGRRTFDVVGLTTAGEAKYWSAGAGSRFEHYEGLPAPIRPTHFIVYPEWMAVDPVLGKPLTWRTVHHTILGGSTMAAYTARYDLLGSGETPRDAALSTRVLVDALDVADLESEKEHAYQLLDATKAGDVVVETSEYADGARKDRHVDAFRLRLAAGGLLVLRLGAPARTLVSVHADGKRLSQVELDGGLVSEAIVAVAGVADGAYDVRVVGESGATFDSLHYWSYR
jgi:hypothetical protein